MGTGMIEQIGVEALMVDEIIQRRDAFRRWKYEYMALNQFASPEATPFSSQLAGKEKGIYLRFILPRRVRTKAEGEPDFPYIPNRWLITRIVKIKGKNEPVCTSWVLESDCPKSAEMKKNPDLEGYMNYAGGYLIGEEIVRAWKEKAEDPYRLNPLLTKAPKGSGGYYVKLGMRYPAEKWRETASDIQVIRSCAPGNPMFSAYTEHNTNMLSLYDDMEGIPIGEISYLVSGWYAAQNVEQYFAGAVYGIPWSKEGTSPTEYEDALKEIAENRSLEVVVAESSKDALRAYTRNYYRQVMSEAELDKLDVRLAAFSQHMVEELGKMGGLCKLSNAVYNERFDSHSGGIHYMIVPEEKIEIELTETEKNLLSRLNGFEQEVGKLRRMRQRLLELWWKRGYLKGMDIKTIQTEWEDFNPALDYDNKGSLMHQAAEQYEKVKVLYKDLWEVFDKEAAAEKSGDKEVDYQRYGKEHGVPDGHILKAVICPRYWQKKNPFLLIKGLELAPDMLLEDPKPQGEETLSGESMTEELPEWMIHMPQMIGRIYQNQRWSFENEEHEPWSQPWKPMFLEWRLSYESRALLKEISENWTFNGTEYEFSGKNNFDKKWVYSGITMLNAEKEDSVKKHFDEQADLLPEEEKKRYGKMIQEIASTRFLGQELSGLKDLTAQKNYKTFRRPYKTEIPGCGRLMEEILGFSDSDKHFLERTGGGADFVPFMRGENVPEFYEIQTGTGHISDLVLYDAFGRVLNVISSQQSSGLCFDDNFSLIVSESMKIAEDRKKNHFLIKPAFLQYANLSIRFDTDNENNPIQGYLLPNSLNNSIIVYQPDGILAGEVAVKVNMEGKRRLCFLGCEDGVFVKNSRISKKYPELQLLVEGILAFGEDTEAFADFMSEIDKTFWTMNPMQGTGGNVSRLAGRPIAVVSAHLWIDAEGDFRRDIGWADVGKENVMPSYLRTGTVPVRIGDAGLRGDGVVGYFIESDYKKFHSVLAQNDFLQVPFGKERSRSVTLLMDPDGSLHGYSGLFPVKEIGLPKQYTKDALEKMEALFHIGTFLTNKSEKEIQIPKFFREKGDWEWLERNKGDWSSCAAKFVSQEVQDEKKVPEIREGILMYKFKEEKNE